MQLRARLVLLFLALVVALALAATGAATSTYSVRLDGVEVPPITSTLGTFVGVARGELPATWRVQIAHESLATAPTVEITGGKFSIYTLTGWRLSGSVTGGSVAVTNPGRGCRDQTYGVTVTFSIGSFDGTLTHHRRSLLGRCLIYSASIRGRAILNA
jgi:hypothetical protein